MKKEVMTLKENEKRDEGYMGRFGRKKLLYIIISKLEKYYTLKPSRLNSMKVRLVPHVQIKNEIYHINQFKDISHM